MFECFVGASWGFLGGIVGAIGGFLGLLGGPWEFEVCNTQYTIHNCLLGCI